MTRSTKQSKQQAPAPAGMPVKLNIRQIGEMIVKNENIHEGLYDVTFEFQIGVGGVSVGGAGGSVPQNVVPGATLGITGVGIVRAKVAGPFTIDASVINPKQ